MMHDATINTIVRDIKLAQGVFGEARIFWPPNLSWLRINNYILPPFYNQGTTDLLIIMPPHYGLVNVPLQEFYMNQGLKVRTRNGWENLPHYHTGSYNKFGSAGWAWFCMHPQNWKASDSILTFLVLADLLLQSPFDWKP